MPTIHTVVDRRRQCGWRRPGGLYLVTSRAGHSCSRFPVPVNPWSTNSTDVRFGYRFAWLSADQVVAIRRRRGGCSGLCPLSRRGELEGLLWVPSRYYETPMAFAREAFTLGVCRAIRHLPRGFEIGKTWVLLAHMGAIVKRLDHSWVATEPKPGIFYAFIPDRVEYVVTGRESDARLSRLEARGIRLVRALKGDETIDLFPEMGAPEAPSPDEEASGANTGR